MIWSNNPLFTQFIHVYTHLYAIQAAKSRNTEKKLADLPKLELASIKALNFTQHALFFTW